MRLLELWAALCEHYWYLQKSDVLLGVIRDLTDPLHGARMKDKIVMGREEMGEGETGSPGRDQFTLKDAGMAPSEHHVGAC